MRYRYLGNKMTDPLLIGLACDPVQNAKGKCIVSGTREAMKPGESIWNGVRIIIIPTDIKQQRNMGSALVQDEQGRRYVVARRRLRINK